MFPFWPVAPAVSARAGEEFVAPRLTLRVTFAGRAALPGPASV